MDTILIFTFIILGLLIVLLAVPVDLAFNINRVSNDHHRFSGQVNVRWLFGMLHFCINIPDTGKLEKAKRKPSREKQSKTSSKEPGSTQLIGLLKNSPFRQRLYKFIKDLLRASHYRDLFLRLRIGVGDPANTGQLWILLGPLAAMARNLRGATVRIEPEFIDPMFNVQSHGKFRFFPIEFIALAVGFALSPPSLRALYSLRHSNAT